MIEISAGFLPLTHSAILIVAKEMGFAETYGINLHLMRETSWANIRDRLAVEQFAIAHCLAPMPIAANLGLTPLSTRIIAPMALGLGGNAVTVSNAIFCEMARYGSINPMDAARTGLILRDVIAERQRKNLTRLQFGVVHPYSAHNFELRYWLASSGISPQTDVNITVLPPALMSDALHSGQIDGFCVGEPWNSVAVDRGAGKIITTKSAIWAASPEKVLAVNAQWATENQASLTALLRALYEAAAWCGEKNNADKLASLLAQPRYLDLKKHLILPALTNTILPDHGAARFFEPFAFAATFPWQSHALWLYSQMARWGQVKHSPHHAEVARQSFRPDLYRDALSPYGISVPSANSKMEGTLSAATTLDAANQPLFMAPGGFFDGAIFDPDQIDAYIAAQLIA